jgi:hypothetical protein
MIKLILELLSTDDFYGVSENVEIAKGKYKIPTTWSSGFEQIKRVLKCLK